MCWGAIEAERTACGCLCRHLAAAEGQLAAVEWLLKSNCTANPVDRFLRTPLDVRYTCNHCGLMHGSSTSHVVLSITSLVCCADTDNYSTPGLS